ncbi:MAG: glutamate 5-kinase [Erysipelotrichaceae bacterium]|nr:glutamate 5-kinase [Erysipelotrichaceae bacterium]
MRDISQIKRIIVKVGSSSLCDANGQINKEKTLNIISQIATLHRRGYMVVLVSSGAVASGMGIMGLDHKPSTLPKKQALAAIGQAHLMEIFEELFAIYNMKCAQILLTHDDFDDRKRLLNMFNTINALSEYGVIPIINENDALATDEIKVGDNDTLSALMVPVVEAQLLILVSDIDGLYTANPQIDENAKFLSYVDKVDKKIMSYAGDAGSAIGTGGMTTKLKAAKMVNAFGTHMCIVNGNKENAIVNALVDEGTWFNGSKGKSMKARPHWIAYRSKAKGSITVDDGCKNAIVNHHRSLLPGGIVDVDGHFTHGQVVDIIDLQGRKIARGISNYANEEVRLIKGLKTSQIESVLHHNDYDEVIHANNIVIMEEEK